MSCNIVRCIALVSRKSDFKIGGGDLHLIEWGGGEGVPLVIEGDLMNDRRGPLNDPVNDRGDPVP